MKQEIHLLTLLRKKNSVAEAALNVIQERQEHLLSQLHYYKQYLENIQKEKSDTPKKRTETGS
jgi:hypothetical protein